ncbi:hypothetical protein ONS96_009615 [Cadophora gregata f. sp. sojae]|nr:hypothetical protein ONS96_009615 [Cadophora gregata f. sp. sojae]
MADGNAEDNFASDYWQRRPALNFNDSEIPLPAESPVINGEVIDSSFDYVHFVKFIALRSIPIINYEDLDFTISQSKSIGSGAAMQVCMATLKNELVAVKQVQSRDANRNPRGQGHVEGVSDKWLNDLYFELQIMSHQPLCEHPNIVQLKGISFDETSDDLYPFLIVEPACEQYPDLTRLTRFSPAKLPSDQVADIIGDIADGISVLHVYGVIHGDIKPDNILIFKTTDRVHGLKAKICDFGFSGSLFSEDSPRGSTPAWAAPELQYNVPESFQEYRKESPQDIYSFALVVMFVILGRLPTMDRDSETSKTMVSDLKPLTPEYPWLEKFIPILEECLQYEPSKRRKSLAKVRESILKQNNEPHNNLWEIAINPFRRDLSHEVDESKIINFSLHNASFIRRVFPSLPSIIQENLIKQVQEALKNDKISSHRMLAIYRTLRTMRPDLAAVKGTDPSLEQNDSDFSKLLFQSHQALSNMTDSRNGNASANDDPWPLNHDWSGMTKSDLKEFVLLTLKASTLWAPQTLLEMKAYKSTRGFGYLTAACRIGNATVVKALLAIGANPNEKSNDGHTPLHAAVVHSHHECAQLILAAGADTEALMSSPMSNHYTALVFAASNGDAKMSEALIKHGANIWHRILDSMQNTAAHTAANGAVPGSAACLELLLKQDPRLALAKKSHQRTPLHHAAGSGDIASVKALLRAGADPNAIDVNKSNPLHTAWFSSLDLVKICSEYFPEKLHDPALKVVVQRSALISSLDHLRPLEVVELLLQAGADPKSVNIEGCDAKISAYLNMLITLKVQPGDTFSSNSVAGSMTPFTPWYSSFPYRRPWTSPLSW